VGVLVAACGGRVRDGGETDEPGAGAGEGGGTAGEMPPASGRGGAGVSGRSGAGGDRAEPSGGRGTAGDPADAATPDAATMEDSGSGATADDAWAPLTVMSIVNPIDHGAMGDGEADDLSALDAAVNALPAAGGVVYLPEGTSFMKADLLAIEQDHVKFWAPNRQAEIFQRVDGVRRRQSLLCRDVQGCGFFGLKLRSDATARFDALEDNQISADGGALIEIEGCEIEGSAATGVFLYGTRESYVHGNYIHHTWADHVHHTNAARDSWVWANFVFNEAPSRGDDGVACVTYGPDSPRCGAMEWWNNTILRTEHGRGYSVIGGEDILIHHNWAIGVAGAGVIVASESSYDTASSERITIANNYVYRSAHTIGHPGILISGLHPSADPLRDIALTDNVSVENGGGGAYRAEGNYMDVTNEGMATDAASLPQPIPGMGDARMVDTAVLRTRDVSHAPAEGRAGLHRIHVRRSAAGEFEQRFEYVVKGEGDAVAQFVTAAEAEGGYLSERRAALGTEYALVLSPEPLALPAGAEGVSFGELRAEDRSGELSWLWQRVDSGEY
jgi:hypothetical protein